MKKNIIIIILILLAAPNFSYRGAEEITSNVINSSVLLRLVSVFILGIICIINSNKILIYVLNNKFLLFTYSLITYFTLSSIWSVYPLWTLYRGLELTVLLSSCLLYIKSENSFNSFLNKVFILINTLIFIAYFNTYFFNISNIFSLSSLSSEFPQLNEGTLGFFSLAGISYNIFFKNLINKKYIYWTSFYFVTLLLSQNRSSLISLIFVLIIYYFSSRNSSKNIFLIYGITFLLLISTLTNFFDLLMFYLSKGQDIELLKTLSTRTINWNFSLDFISQQNIFYRLFGLGAYAGVRFLVAPTGFFVTQQGISQTTTDNLWLETYIDNGIIGVVYTLIFFVYLYLQISKIKNKNLKLFNTSLIIIFFIRGFFTANIFQHNNLILIFVIISSAIKIKDNYYLNKKFNNQ